MSQTSRHKRKKDDRSLRNSACLKVLSYDRSLRNRFFTPKKKTPGNNHVPQAFFFERGSQAASRRRSEKSAVKLAECDSSHERNLSVPKGFNPVHSSGQPINHSTHVGFSRPPLDVIALRSVSVMMPCAWSFFACAIEPEPPHIPRVLGVGYRTALSRLGDFRRRSHGLSPRLASLARGVGNCAVLRCKALRELLPPSSPLQFGVWKNVIPSGVGRTGFAATNSHGVGSLRPLRNRAERIVVETVGVPIHGEDPDTFADMRGTDVVRAHNQPFRIVPERGKVTKDSCKTSADEHRAVFHVREARSNLTDDPRALAPQSGTRAVDACAFARG